MSFLVGWRQVGLGFVLLATVSMIASCYSILAVPLLEEFKPSRFVLGLVMLVLSAVCALLSPVLGAFMDRVPLRWLMLAGGLLISAGYATLSFATSFTHVLIVFGLFMAPANVLLGPMAVTVLLSRWFSKNRGFAIGIAIAGVSTGSIVYPMIIQGLLNANEWRIAFQLLGLLLLAVTIPCALLVVNHPHDRGLHADGADEDPPAVQAARAGQRISARQVLADPSFWLLVLVTGVVTAGMKGMVTNLSPMAIDNGVTPTAAAALISIFGTAGLVSKGVFALASDRINPRLLLLVCLAGFGFGMAMLTQAHNGYGAILLGIWLVGMFGGMMVPLQAFLMPRIFGENVVGKAFGLVSGASLLLLMSSPPLFGLIHDRTGSYAAIFVTFAGLAVVGIVAALTMRLHPRRGPLADSPEPALAIP